MDEQTHSVTQSIFQFKLRIRSLTCTCCVCQVWQRVRQLPGRRRRWDDERLRVRAERRRGGGGGRACAAGEYKTDQPEHHQQVRHTQVSTLTFITTIRIHRARIRIQHFTLSTNPDPELFMIKKKFLQKLQLKNIWIFFGSELQFTYPRPP